MNSFNINESYYCVADVKIFWSVAKGSYVTDVVEEFIEIFFKV